MLNQPTHALDFKIVLDVGCGTGILCMFAAQAGAKRVFGIDCSSIIDQAKVIVQKNGFASQIELIKGKVEEVELPVQKVDIICSEWMGYFLLYESMLDTVLFARDKWLKTGGLLLPDKVTMYICGLEDAAVRRDRIDFWDDVYGFDMTPLKDIALHEPVVDVVAKEAIVTNAVPILDLNILTCTKEDAAFTADFIIQAHRNDFIHGLVTYFECGFTQVHKPIAFSTAPFARYTHWKQTIMYLEEPITICQGEKLSGTISCKPNQKNQRDLDISVTIQFKGSHCESFKEMSYRLR